MGKKENVAVSIVLAAAKAMPPKVSLAPYKSAILILREKGYSWRDIADFLAGQGIAADHTKVYRFMKK